MTLATSLYIIPPSSTAWLRTARHPTTPHASNPFVVIMPVVCNSLPTLTVFALHTYPWPVIRHLSQPPALRYASFIYSFKHPNLPFSVGAAALLEGHRSNSNCAATHQSDPIVSVYTILAIPTLAPSLLAPSSSC
ncbi:hypothetical protein DL93DRAFT_2228125 [Clavulina sp. PMI_390]|nr:hypothetical protein DL93DRAFT_2228125 [Clavulina sp. PMI_390]